MDDLLRLVGYIVFYYIIYIYIILPFYYETIANDSASTKTEDNSNTITPKTDFIKEEKEVTHNHYTQNNTYIQQNNYYGKESKSEDENKDHTERVWNKMGYKVKYGETYSYKFYGNEIFTPDQVEEKGNYEVRYSESGLAHKLLQNTGSKSEARHILVEDYGLSESRAKKLLK